MPVYRNETELHINTILTTHFLFVSLICTSIFLSINCCIILCVRVWTNHRHSLHNKFNCISHGPFLPVLQSMPGVLLHSKSTIKHSNSGIFNVDETDEWFLFISWFCKLAGKVTLIIQALMLKYQITCQENITLVEQKYKTFWFYKYKKKKKIPVYWQIY